MRFVLHILIAFSRYILHESGMAGKFSYLSFVLLASFAVLTLAHDGYQQPYASTSNTYTQQPTTYPWIEPCSTACAGCVFCYEVVSGCLTSKESILICFLVPFLLSIWLGYVILQQLWKILPYEVFQFLHEL